MAGVSDDATSIMEPEVRRRNDRAAIPVVTPILGAGGPLYENASLSVCLSTSLPPAVLIVLSPKCSRLLHSSPDSRSRLAAGLAGLVMPSTQCRWLQ